MTTKVTKDDVARVVRAVQDLASSKVLVGIPMEDASRRDGEPITNAQIGYIQETGSPAANIPARSFLVPGVEDAQEAIAAAFKRGAKGALDGNGAAPDQALHAAGLMGQSAARARLNSGDHAPLSPVTLQLRYWAKRGVKITGKTVGYAAFLVEKGLASYPGVSTKPLVVTGQLRNAITYVIRKKA